MPLDLPYVDALHRSFANVFQPFEDTRLEEVKRKQQLEDAARIREQNLMDEARRRTQQLSDQEAAERAQATRDYRMFDLRRATELEDQETQRQRFFDEEEARLQYAKQLSEFNYLQADKAKKADLLEKAREEAIAAGAEVTDTDTIGDLVLKKEEQNGKRLEAALGEMGKVQSEYFQASGRDVQARIKQETELALQDPTVRKTVPMEDQAKLVAGAPVNTILDQYSRTNPKGWQALHDALFNAHRQLLQEDAQNDQGKEVILNLNKRLTQASKDVEDAMKLVHNPQAVVNGYSARRAAETTARPTQTGPNLTLPPPGVTRPQTVNPIVPASRVPVVPAPVVPVPIAQPQVNYMGQPIMTQGTAMMGAPSVAAPSTLSNPFAPIGQYLMGGTVADRAREAAMVRQQQQNQATNALFFPTSTGTLPVVQ